MMGMRRSDNAFTALKSLQDESFSAAVLNNLGVVQVRRGATAETGKATYYFTQAAKAEPDEPDLLFNLGYAYALDRDPQGAIYWLRESLRRNPADGDAHIVLAAELDAAGRAAEAVRERETCRPNCRRSMRTPRNVWARRFSQPVSSGFERIWSRVARSRWTRRLSTRPARSAGSRTFPPRAGPSSFRAGAGCRSHGRVASGCVSLAV